MCMLCEGASAQDVLDGFRSRIAEFGFTMVSVGGGSSSWTYTIGLLENFGHPELVVTGLCPKMIKLIDGDGWVLARRHGSHRQYIHALKTGTVTVAGNLGAEMRPGTLASVMRQAGLKGPTR